MGYPHAFRPNNSVDLYNAAGMLLAAGLNCQVMKPMLAYSTNQYVSGGATVFAAGATILRVVVEVGGPLSSDVPYNANLYFQFQGDTANRKWRIASYFYWHNPTGPKYASAFLGEFV